VRQLGCRPVIASFMGFVAVCWAVGIAAATAHAQQPVLRVADQPVQGVSEGGVALFPIAVLERLGFRLAGADAQTFATLAGDTLRFWSTSPYFRVGSAVQQLAHPVSYVGGGIHLPEQFFIQWLPARYPDRFEFRGGALALRGAALPAATGATGAPAARWCGAAVTAAAASRRRH
jgi:hypothetical protein